jgi:hypothetical protein
MSTTDTDSKCQHTTIKTWVYEDTGAPSGFWSCADCGLRFEPLKPNDSTHAQDVLKEALGFDVEKLAIEAGATYVMVKDYGNRMYVWNGNLILTPDALAQYTRLVLEEAAALADRKARCISLIANETHLAELAAAIRALAEGVR